MQTVFLILTTFILTIVLGFMVFTIYRDCRHREMEFQLKLESIKHAGASNIKSMSFKDLLNIIDTNMGYYVDQAILVSGINLKKSDEERSIIFNDVLISTCAQTESSLSLDVRNAILAFVSENHLQTYIKDRTRILLIAKIEQTIMTNKTI